MRSVAPLGLCLLLASCAATDERGTTDLMRAAAAGDVARVRLLLDAGAPVDAHVEGSIVQDVQAFVALLRFFAEAPPKRDVGYSALMYAAEAGHADVVDLLLGAGADVKARDQLGHNALLLAVRSVPARGIHSNPPIVRSLIAAGSDVNVTGGFAYRRWTALMYAAAAGDDEVAGMLLGASAVTDVADKDGFTALMLAARQGHAPVVRRLLDAGAGTELRDQAARRTALDWADAEGRAEVVKLLAQAGASTAGLQDVALIDAVTRGQLDEVRRVLAAGARADARNSRGESALFIAAGRASPEIVGALLDAGATVNFRHTTYGTPLREATMRGHVENVRRLLAAGADPNAPRESPLALAALAARLDLVEMLLAAQADVNAGSGGPLREACRGRDVGVVKRLLAAGARPNLRSDSSTTALIQAALIGNAQMVKVLLAAGADPNQADDIDATPLTVAAGLGNDEVVRMLLAAGAEPNRRRDGETPLRLALKSGHHDVAEQLRHAGGKE